MTGVYIMLGTMILFAVVVATWDVLTRRHDRKRQAESRGRE